MFPGDYNFSRNREADQVAWEKGIKLPENELKEVLSKDDKICDLAINWLERNPNASLHDIENVSKFMRCVPNQFAKDPRMGTILSRIKQHDDNIDSTMNPFTILSQKIWPSQRLSPEMEKTLLACIKDGNLLMAKAILDQGFHCPQEQLNQFLNAACKQGHDDFAIELFNRGAQPKGETLYYLACTGLEKGNNKVANKCLEMIKQSPNPDIVNFQKNGKNILHYLCEKDPSDLKQMKALWDASDEMVLLRKLVKLGNEKMLNEVDSKGNTPLHFACLKGNADILIEFTNTGVNVNVANNAGVTPLHNACEAKMYYEQLSSLVSKGANPYAADAKGRLPLTIIFSSGSDSQISTLLSNSSDTKADLSKLDESLVNAVHPETKKTLLHYACEAGHINLAAALLERGADPNQADAKGNTPLMLACSSMNRNRSEALAMTLIKGGADPNKTNEAGNTAFILACNNGFGTVALALLDGVVDLNKPNLVGETPLHLALQYGLDELATALIAKGANLLASSPTMMTPIGSGLRSQTQFTQNLLKDFPEFLEMSKSIKKRDDLWYLRDCREVVQKWLASNPKCPEGRSLIEVPLLLGMTDIVTREFKKMSPIERRKTIELLEKRYPNMSFVSFSWELNGTHYDQGAVLSEKPPKDIPGLSISARLTEGLQGNEDLKPQIDEMLGKLKNRTRIVGLGVEEKTQDQVEAWYHQFECYLKNVIVAYKIGEEGGDPEMKRYILSSLASMQINCNPRWDQEIRQLNRFRPRDPSAPVDPDDAPPTTKDRVLGQLRGVRLDIVTTRLLKFGHGNVHEPNYLINTYNDSLGLRVDHIDDPYAKPDLYDAQHPLEEDLQKFHKYYNPETVVNNLKDSFIAHQRSLDNLQRLSSFSAELAGLDLEEIKEKATAVGINLKANSVEEAHKKIKALYDELKKQPKDPLASEPAALYDWLREYRAIDWQSDDYNAIPSKANEMRQQGKSDLEIKKWMQEEYGVNWKLVDKKEVEANVINGLKNKLKPLETRLKLVQRNPKMSESVQKDIASITQFLTKYENAKTDDERLNVILAVKVAEGESRMKTLENEIKGIEFHREIDADAGIFRVDTPEEIQDKEKAIKEKTEELNKIKNGLSALTPNTTTEERTKLLEEAGLIPKSESLSEAVSPARLKEAQIAFFMEKAFSGAQNEITNFGVQQLLASMEIFSPL